jgi:hypothetical protein
MATTIRVEQDRESTKGTGSRGLVAHREKSGRRRSRAWFIYI